MSGLTVRLDPHVHSAASYDGHEPVELLLEYAAEIGLDAVVITDHDTMGASRRAAAIAEEYGLIGIPGVEVSTAHGHLLALGVDRMPPRRAAYADTIRWIHDRGGVAIVPHPFQRSRHGVRRRDVPIPDDGGTAAGESGGGDPTPDAIEVFNAWLFTGYRNRRARRFATSYDFPGVAASDAHHLQYVGRAFTEVRIDDRASVEAVTPDDVLAAIRRGTTRVDGRRAPVRMAARHYLTAADEKSRYYATQGAIRGVTATVAGTKAAATLGRVGIAQGIHRTRRALSWFR